MLQIQIQFKKKAIRINLGGIGLIYKAIINPKNSKQGTVKNLKLQKAAQNDVIHQVGLDFDAFVNKIEQNPSQIRQKYVNDDEEEDNDAAPFSQNIAITDTLLKEIQIALKEIRIGEKDITNTTQTHLIKKYQFVHL
ncbi:hypothetical protein ABPG72_011584 [Tetrahymena utriculariae]